MPQINGFLNRIEERPSKFGTYYNLVVDGKTYDTGSKFPPKGVAANDYITFELRKKDNGYETIVQGSLSKSAPPAGVTPEAAAKAVAIASGPDKQEVISKQSALNSALAMVGLIVQAGGMPAGAKTNPATVVEKLEAMVNHYTAGYYQQSTGQVFEVVEAAADGAVDWSAAE